MIQGSAADIIKLEMQSVNNLHRETGGAMVNQVHDEIVGYVEDEEQAQAVANSLTCVHHGMDFPVSVGTGSNWLKAKK